MADEEKNEASHQLCSNFASHISEMSPGTENRALGQTEGTPTVQKGIYGTELALQSREWKKSKLWKEQALNSSSNQKGFQAQRLN